MDNWSEEEKTDFLFHYQSTHLKENAPNNYLKCHFKRQSTHQILQVAQKVTNNETTCHILKTKLREYSATVDKQDGVNNYANAVLDLVSHTPNEAQRWTSQANAADLIEEFLKPSAGVCLNRRENGCGAQVPTTAEIETFLKNRKPFPTLLSSTSMTKPVATHVTNGQIPSFARGKSIDQQSAGEGGKKLPSTSRVMTVIESRVFGTSKGGEGLFDQSAVPQIQPKSQPNCSFRTAGTELKLQNSKKYGQGIGGSGVGDSCKKYGQGMGGDSLNYGSGKKSLGGRARAVNSKFVPPVKSDSQESSQPEEVDVDERLRLIEPKLVELVRSEIMDYGPPVSWDDIAGLHFAKATIQEIVVLPMLRPDIFTGLRRPPKGILLFGPPGTGKTLIGKCIASQSKSTFFNISASSLTSKWVGEGEKMVRVLFTLARIHQPAVVFIDEIDSLLSQRSETEHESSRRIKTEFLVQLDGAGTGEDDRILVIGATNRPQELDEAARRRLVKRLYIPLPDHPARCEIVRNLMTSERHELTEEQVEEVASLTEGYSGADMKTVCQEASLGPLRSLSYSQMQHISPDQVRPVTVEDFKAALRRVRSSVSPKDLEAYITWDHTYGSSGPPK